MSVAGRVLDAPTVHSADQRDQFHQAAKPPGRWSVILLDPAQSDLVIKRFVAQLMARAGELGLHLALPSPVAKLAVRDHTDLFNVFINLYKMKNTELVFVGLPTRK